MLGMNNRPLIYFQAQHCVGRDDEIIALRDPGKVDVEMAEQVFHKVLGHKVGHIKRLGNSTIPKPSPTS